MTRVWSNFEFIAAHDSVNGVDLLIFSPQGFFVVEIKSHQGCISRNAAMWTFEYGGKWFAMDNPLFSANLQAKQLVPHMILFSLAE